jgi:serine/threonine-protein kinase HipA
MTEKVNGLDVYFRDTLAGCLWLDERRRFVFRYDDGWLKSTSVFPLSLSLPLRGEPYEDDAARPFFANLLPEGEIRALIARQFRLSEQNVFALLEKIGGECAGAVSILPGGAKPVVRSGYRELDEEGLHKVLAELPRRPLLAGEKGIRLSLAGAQNKLPVFIDDKKKICIATGNSPSTHILKPPIPRIEESVENEAFCMELASRFGLPVADALIRKNQDTILVVSRYDREKNNDGTILRLHQEDFCQALGILPEQKYESEGGPSLEKCFTLLKEHSIRPAADQRALLGWTIFNVLIGNADAHAKNLSILFTDKGPRLAPFYDLLSTQVYPNLAEKLAMKIGGENRVGWLHARNWERFADVVSLKRRYVLSTVRGMADKIVSVADPIAGSFAEAHDGERIVGRIMELLRKRARTLAQMIDSTA